MLGILNPDRKLHRSRSEIISAGSSSPRCLSMSSVPRASPNTAAIGGFGVGAGAVDSPRMRFRRDSLPGALSLTEAYNVMSVDVSLLYFSVVCTILTLNFFFFKRNAVLATIDMLNINSPTQVFSNTTTTTTTTTTTAVPSSSF